MMIYLNSRVEKVICPGKQPDWVDFCVQHSAGSIFLTSADLKSFALKRGEALKNKR